MMMNRYKLLLAGGAIAAGVLFACAPLTRDLASPAPASPIRDYLDPELRREVEQLKADLALAPTGLANYEARTKVFWRWGNAAARAGLEMNPGFSSQLARRPNFAASAEPVLRQAFGNVDDMIRELAWREANPDGVGRLTTPTPGPFVAESYTSITQVYTVGAVPIIPGGGVLFTPYIYIGGIAFQTEDPKKDNYLSVTASRPGVRFELSTQKVGPIMSGAITGDPRDRPFFRLVEGRLEAGDTVTVTLGETSGGSRGYRVPNFQTSGLRMKVWIRHSSDSPNIVLPEIQFPVVGLPEVRSVRAFAPSVLAAGECADITVRTEDRYLNRSTSLAPAYILMDGPKTLASLPAGGGAIQTFSSVCFSDPGVKRLKILSGDGALSAETNPVLVETKPQSRIFWGETHGHSGFAEGNGTVDGYYRFAREDARLDFAALSEHDLWMDDAEWEALRAGAGRHSRNGAFIAFLGYEWTQQSAFGGHHNVIFRNGETARRVPVQEAPTLGPFYTRLKEDNRPEDVVVIPHAHMAADFRTSDPAIERMVEIASNHGAFEWLGKAYLSEGWKVGFLGGSDSHTEHPGLRVLRSDLPQSDFPGGLAAIYAPSLTRDDLFDALHARTGYATNGAKIVLRTSVNGSSGREAEARATARIEGLVAGVAPIASVTLVKNGRDVETRDYTRLEGSPGRTGLLRLRLFSESDPKARLVPSRETRNWTASLVLEGARIAGLSSDGHTNIYTESLERSPDNPNEIRFNLRTHGAPKDILIRLEDIGPDARVRFKGESGLGYGRVLTEREPVEAQILLSEVARAPATRPASVKFPEDTFDLRFVSPVTERDRPILFEDAQSQPGDSYYVRVLQTDGGMAWSSAAWITP